MSAIWVTVCNFALTAFPARVVAQEMSILWQSRVGVRCCRRVCSIEMQPDRPLERIVPNTASVTTAVVVSKANRFRTHRGTERRIQPCLS